MSVMPSWRRVSAAAMAACWEALWPRTSACRSTAGSAKCSRRGGATLSSGALLASSARSRNGGKSFRLHSACRHKCHDVTGSQTQSLTHSDP